MIKYSSKYKIIAEGKCVQGNLPEEYTQVEYLGSNSQAYIDTGIAGNNYNLEIGIEFEYNTHINYGSLFGNWVSDDNNAIRCIISDIQDRLYANSNNKAGSPTVVVCTRATKHNLILNNTKIIVDGSGTSLHSEPIGAANNSNIALFNRSVTNADTERDIGLMVYSFYIKNNGVLIQNLIPCRRNSDSVLGMYDTVTNTFLTNAGTGTFTAGNDVVPNPTAPMDIVCNNGIIKARMASGLPLGYTKVEYIGSNGTQWIDTGVNGTQITRFVVKGTCTGTLSNNNFQLLGGTSNSAYTFFGCRVTNGVSFWYCRSSSESSLGDPSHLSIIDCTINSSLSQTGTLTDTVTGTTQEFTSLSTIGWGFSDENLLLFGGDSTRLSTDATCYELKLYTSSGLVRDFIPCKNSLGVYGMYDTVNDVFYTNQGTGTFTYGADDDNLEIYTDGTIETVTDNAGNVATCQNLLSVGDYKDTQEILTGVVTRNVGIKVLDGSENWVYEKSYLMNMYSLVISDLYTEVSYAATNRQTPFCTHFNRSTNWITPDNRADMIQALKLGSSMSIIGLGYGTPSDLNLNDFKQWLTDQYNAGTPVVIIYPLATPTVETVTPQVLSNSVVTQTTGSISNMPIYKVPAGLIKRYITNNNGVLSEVKRIYIGNNLSYQNYN